MWNLRIDAAIGEVVEALRQGDADSFVLKGPTLADWYPPDSRRTYVDGDIWVAPADLRLAQEVLASHGFKPLIDEHGLPEWWEEHASSWLRERDRGKIDLHRRLQGVGAEPQHAWSVLWPRREEFSVGGVAAHRLCEPGRALYAALHAMHHGANDSRGLPHLRAALDAVSDQVWSEALGLARELEALEAFATGLRLLQAGNELAERIRVPDVRSVKTTLLATTPPPVALGLDQLSGVRGWRRAEIVIRKLAPPPGFIRHWWPPAAENRRMLALGYLYRPVWLVQRAPAGYRAWRAAKREANKSL